MRACDSLEHGDELTRGNEPIRGLTVLHSSTFESIQEFQCAAMFLSPFSQLFPPSLWSDQCHPPPLKRPHRTASVCKAARGVIPAIASSPATSNAWLPRAVPMHIAGSIR